MKISQREARGLRRRVKQLEEKEQARRRSWAMDYPGGTEIASGKYEQWNYLPVAIRTARKLGHAVICLADNEGNVRFVALDLAK